MIAGIIIGCVIGAVFGVFIMALLSCSRVESPPLKPYVTFEAEDVSQLIETLRAFKLSVESAKQDSCNLACECLRSDQVDKIIELLASYLSLLEPTSMIDACALNRKQAAICKVVAESHSTSWLIDSLESTSSEFVRSLSFFDTCSPDLRTSALFNLADSVSNMLILLEMLMYSVNNLQEWVPNKTAKNTTVLKYTYIDKAES